MRPLTIVLICTLSAATQGQSLQAVPDNVDLGACNAFEEKDDSCIRLKARMDPSKVSRVPKGYPLSRVTFYEGEPTDEDAVTLLGDGFK